GAFCSEGVCVDFCASSAGLVAGVCATAATELNNSDAVKTKALVAREKLFISKNLQKFRMTLRAGVADVLSLNPDAQSMMLRVGDLVVWPITTSWPGGFGSSRLLRPQYTYAGREKKAKVAGVDHRYRTTRD